MNNIIAIDPSLSSTGIAIFKMNNSNIVYPDVPYCLRITTSPKNMDTDERIMHICNEIDKLAHSYFVRYVVFEDGFIGASAKTGLQLAELRGALCYMLKSQGYMVYHMLPSEIRKAFGLKGNAKKEKVAEEVIKIYRGIDSIIGPYSDKSNKDKTSDMYDAVSIGLGFKYKYIDNA